MSDEPLTLPGMIGQDPKMLAVYRQVHRYATRRVPIAIIGETGTGKELVARAIHELSDRSSGRFIDINCAALPESLAEGELFGWERGAFTGAVGSATGLIDTANLGTLFLDEACSLSLGLQAKLLRVIEQQEFRKLGGRETRRSSFRVIVAVSAPLDELVQTGKLRPDFVYRVSTVCVQIPPLRERQGDLVDLANHFLARANENGHPSKVIGEDAVPILRRHAWPGNVRELRSVMERLEAECADDVVTARDLALQVHLLNEEAELSRALLATGWDISKAARDLGISRSTVYEHVKKYGLQRPGSIAEPVVGADPVRSEQMPVSTRH